MTTPLFRDGRLRVYIAGASKDIDRAHRVAAALREHSAEVAVVSTWLERLPLTRARYLAKSDRDVPRDALVADLAQDLAEVASADLLLKLAGRSDGAACEWGYGLAKGHAGGGPLLVVAGDAGAFELLADHICASDEDAIAWVLAEARGEHDPDDDAEALAASRGAKEG